MAPAGHRSEYSPRAEIVVEGATNQKRDDGIVVTATLLTRLQAAYKQTLESMHKQEPDKQHGFSPTHVAAQFATQWGPLIDLI